jgi:hypothetical protein
MANKINKTGPGGGKVSNYKFIGWSPEVKGETELLFGDFDKDMKASKLNEYLESNPVTVGEGTFTIIVYPNGWDREGQVGVYLKNKKDKDVVVKWCKITVGEVSKEFTDKNLQPRGRLGWDSWFATHDECRAALEDGKFRVKAEVEMPGERIVLDMDPDDGPKSGWILANLYENRADADFALTCEGQAVPVHSQVLAGASSFFMGLLGPRWGGPERDNIEFDCTAEVGELFVKFLYTDQIDQVSMDQNLTAFLMISDFTMMEQLKQQVESRMIRLLNRDNMIKFFLAGNKHNGQKIRSKAKQFLRASREWLRRQAGWKEAFGTEKRALLFPEVTRSWEF